MTNCELVTSGGGWGGWGGGLRGGGRSPLALPGAAGDAGEGRLKAVDVVADVTLVTQDETPLVMWLATTLTHGAVKTPPSLLKHHLVDLHRGQVRTGRQVRACHNPHPRSSRDAIPSAAPPC